MEINAIEWNGVTVFPLTGRLDGSNATEAEQAFLQLVGDGKQQFIFDFSELQYISSAGLRVVLVAAKKLRASKGQMVCACLGEQVYDVFEMSGFTKILQITKTKEEALAKLGEGN